MAGEENYFILLGLDPSTDDLAAIDLDLTCAVAEVALEVIRSAFWRA